MLSVIEDLVALVVILFLGPICVYCAKKKKIWLNFLNPRWKDISLDKFWQRFAVGAIGVIIWVVAIFVILLYFCSSFPNNAPCKILNTVLNRKYTSTPTPTSTFTPTATPTATFTLTPTPTSTPTASPTSTSAKSCPYQGVDDNQTIVNLIQMEAVASNTKDMSIIQAIFSADAVFHDYSKTPSTVWVGPIDRYQDDLFLHTDLRNVEHFDILPAGNGIVGDRATYTSGSSGETKDGAFWKSFSNGSSKTTQFGSDHWILSKNDLGCWVIIQFDFNASHIQFP